MNQSIDLKYHQNTNNMRDIIFYHTYKGSRYTLVAVFDGLDSWNLGIAKCHPQDRFEKKVGRSVAASSALVNPYETLTNTRENMVYYVKNNIDKILSDYNRTKSNAGKSKRKKEEAAFLDEMSRHGWQEYMSGLYFTHENGTEANPESEYPYFPGWWRIGEDESASKILFKNKEQFFKVTQILYDES